MITESRCQEEILDILLLIARHRLRDSGEAPTEQMTQKNLEGMSEKSYY